MTQDEFRLLLKKYQAGTCTPAEKELIEAFDAKLVESNSIEMSDIESKELEQKYLLNIEQKLRSSNRLRISSPTGRYISIAASLLLLIASTLYLVRDYYPVAGQRSVVANSPVVITNTTSEAMDVTLPDGSIVTLQPGGALTYKDGFELAKREITLEGTAFFDVSRDEKRPFFVYTRDVVTKVLGTSFTIEAERHAAKVVVSVRTGQVSVSSREKSSPEKKEVLLTPNHKVEVNFESQTIETGLVERPLPVLEEEQVRKLKFENTSATDVLLALEKMYGVDIVFDEASMESCKIKTTISEGEMFNRLDIICNAIGATYTVDGTTVTIHGGGCY